MRICAERESLPIWLPLRKVKNRYRFFRGKYNYGKTSARRDGGQVETRVAHFSNINNY